MRYRLIILILLLLPKISSAETERPVSGALLQHIYALSDKNLNYSSPIDDDTVLLYCAQIKPWILNQKRTNDLFKIEQIAINSLSLKGDLGLAANRSQEMYQLAKSTNSNLGMALSLQAIGNTYMHSNQSQQAYDAYSEAETHLENVQDDWVKIRVLIQKIHVCMEMDSLECMQKNINQAHQLLKSSALANNKEYLFYTLCYQTFHDISAGDITQAQHNLQQALAIRLPDHLFDRWHYQLQSRYFALIGENKTALQYCDSALVEVLKTGDIKGYKEVIITKASLLEKNDEIKEACALYETITHLTDSLHQSSYSRQIDSLHASYLVDQLSIRHATLQNKLLSRLSIYAILCAIVGGIVMLVIKKQNKKLIHSRNQLKKMRTESADSIQSKNLFLSNMSHELRTPLNAIVGFANILAFEEELTPEVKKECSDLINQNSDLLLKLFNDVADLSALKDRKLTFTYAPCDAVFLCSNVINTVINVKRTAAQIQFKTTLHKLELFTDAGRLQQVLINLLVNATKFTNDGSITLTLEVDQVAHEARFIVEDTGCGIPLEKQAHIFERFEKLHEGVQGTGLGLSICQLIVQHCRGKIWIDPTYTQGARFIFTHPLVNKPQ